MTRRMVERRESKMSFVEDMESELAEHFGDFKYEMGDMVEIPETWAATPWCALAYGPRQGCTNLDGPYWDTDDPLLGIVRMFRTLYERLSHEVDKTAFAVVDPSYESETLVAVISGDRRRLLYYCQMKAWHLQWDTPDELEQAMQKVVAEMRKNAERGKG